MVGPACGGRRRGRRSRPRCRPSTPAQHRQQEVDADGARLRQRQPGQPQQPPGPRAQRNSGGSFGQPAGPARSTSAPPSIQASRPAGSTGRLRQGPTGSRADWRHTGPQQRATATAGRRRRQRHSGVPIPSRRSADQHQVNRQKAGDWMQKGRQQQRQQHQRGDHALAEHGRPAVRRHAAPHGPHSGPFARGAANDTLPSKRRSRQPPRRRRSRGIPAQRRAHARRNRATGNR
jgi:hypothetical protein